MATCPTVSGAGEVARKAARKAARKVARKVGEVTALSRCTRQVRGHGELMGEDAVGQGWETASAGAHLQGAVDAAAEIRGDAIALLTAASREGSVDEEGIGVVLAGYLSGAPTANEVRLGVLVGSLLGISRAHLQLLADVHECEVGEIIRAVAIASQEA